MRQATMKSIFGLLRMRPRPWLLTVSLLIAGFPAMRTALAQTAPQGSNQLTAVTATKLPGDRVQLQLKLNAPASKPLSFTVGQPARIALDLDDTRMALSNRETDINVGNVNSVVAAEAGTRTRVVVNLTSLVPYNVSANFHGRSAAQGKSRCRNSSACGLGDRK